MEEQQPNFFEQLVDRLFGWRRKAAETPALPEPEAVPQLPMPETPELLPERAGVDGFTFPRTPAVEHVFRSIARNPSRYVELLHMIHNAPAEARGEMAAAWMLEHYPEAWEEVRETHARLRPSLPHRLQSEEVMLTLVSDQWGESLYHWANHLALTSPAYQRASERLAAARLAEDLPYEERQAYR